MAGRSSGAVRRGVFLVLMMGLPAAGFGQIVINEIMQNPSAVLDSAGEWFELYNAGTAEVDLVGWVIKDDGSNTHTLATANGTTTIAAGGYLVLGINGNSSENGGVTVDYDYPSNWSLGNSDDEVVLENDAGVEQDRVAYDNGATFPDPNGASMALRATDLDNNVGDNWCTSPTEWSGSAGDEGTPGAANDCPEQGPPEFTGEIHEIQGNGAASPYIGSIATTNDNAVTAVGAGGFFIQTPAARSDDDADTSDGIFVVHGGTPAVMVGDMVSVVGEVEEFVGFTRIDATVDGGSVTVGGTATVPAPIAFGATRPSPNPAMPSCAMEYECYEGMLISVAVGTVATPNQSFRSDPVAEMYITPTGSRAFREQGLEYPGMPSNPSIPVWDGNPELFELDPDKLGLDNETWVPGTTFNATGILGFEFGGYEIWPTALEALVEAAPLPHAVRQREAGEVTVASLNVQNLGSGRSGYDDKLAKLSLYIRQVLGAPDILAVQEVYALSDLMDLADKLWSDDASASYSAYLEDGNNEPNGIDVGFLVRPDITVESVTQYGRGDTFENPTTGNQDHVHDRPPLLLEAQVGGTPLTVIVLHNRSLIDIGTARVQAKRLAQAQSVAELVQFLQDDRLIIVGDFNAFQFTDGYVDVTGQIAGTVVPSENLLSGPDLVQPNLINLIDQLPASERYSYIFRGNAQALDHALVNLTLLPDVVGIAFGRGNADALEAFEEDATSPLASSDHDGFVVYLRAPGRPAPGEDPVGPGPPGPPPTPQADLSVQASATPSPGGFQVAVTVSNAGPSQALGVAVNSTFASLDQDIVVATSGCDEAGGVPVCSLGNIAVGESASFTVVVTGSAGSEHLVTYGASVTAATEDPTPEDAAATLTHPLGPPHAPSGLAAMTIGHTEIELSWQDNSAVETGYAVFIQGPGDSKLRQIGMAPANAMSTIVDELVPSITYRFAVAAVSNGLSSERTEKVTATTWRAEAAHCEEGDVLCLGRFQVEVDWMTGDGRSGTGQATQLTAETGDFWFFGPENVEVVVKVLDGCAINDHYWVFAAGLTDVGTKLVVRDLVTGESRTWMNEVGTRFAPITDSKALAICGTMAASAAREPGQVVLGGAPTLRDVSPDETGHGPGVERSASSDSCTASDTTLCLLDDHHAVSVNWKAGERSGKGMGVNRTDETGMFWFFNEDNVEVIAKVLDGCAINGYRWVLAAGLTDVAVELVVTDTETGTSLMYRSEEGSHFGAFDTAAFACSR